jgi:hypothetical protein
MNQFRSILLCSLFLLSGILAPPLMTLNAQSTKSNLEKYWLYRQRLIDKFLIVGPNPGESMPAANYDDFYNDVGGTYHDLDGKSVLTWSDGSGHLGYYIAMLATESRVLELTGESSSKTIEELYFALNAVWRIDATSGYYSYVDSDYPTTSCYSPNPSQIPQMNATNYNDPNILDGFFMRDDVPPSFNTHWPTTIDTVSSNLIAPNSHNCIGKEESQDQAFAILLGLICVREFIPANVQYNGVPLRDFAIFEAIKIIEWLKGNGDWAIRNPHLTGSPRVDNNGASGVGFGAGEVYAGLRFSSSTNLTNWSSILQNPIWQVLQYPHYLPPSVKYNNEPMLANLAAVGNSWGPCPTVIIPSGNLFVMLGLTAEGQYAACLLTVGATTTATRRGLDRYAARAKEAQYLVHHLIYNSNWNNSDHISETSILAMLNSAPCDGPSSPWPNSGNYGWTTENRFWVNRKSPDGNNDNLENGKRNTTGQIYPGIDYMLLHNLYYLWRFHNGLGNPFEFPYENLSEAVIDHDWPIQTIIGQIYNGSNGTPMFLRAIHSITSDHKIKAVPNAAANDPRNANVTYRAGDYIELLDGFEVDFNANFEAYIGPIECINGQIYRDSGGMSEDELLIKGIYDAADAEDDSLHANLLDSLGMTEEQYALAWDSLYWNLLDSNANGGNSNQRLAATQGDPWSAEMTATLSPNPTQARATLRLQLTTDTEVEIKLLNVDGRYHQLIFPMGNLSAGTHAFEINTRDLAPGIFKVTVFAPTQVLVKTLVKLD